MHGHRRRRQGASVQLLPAGKPRHWAKQAKPYAFAVVAFGVAEAEAAIAELVTGFEEERVWPVNLRLAKALHAADGGVAAVQRFGRAAHEQLAELWEWAARGLLRPGVMMETQESAWVLSLSGLRRRRNIDALRGVLLGLPVVLPAEDALLLAPWQVADGQLGAATACVIEQLQHAIVMAYEVALAAAGAPPVVLASLPGIAPVAQQTLAYVAGSIV